MFGRINILKIKISRKKGLYSYLKTSILKINHSHIHTHTHKHCGGHSKKDEHAGKIFVVIVCIGYIDTTPSRVNDIVCLHAHAGSDSLIPYDIIRGGLPGLLGKGG